MNHLLFQVPLSDNYTIDIGEVGELDYRNESPSPSPSEPASDITPGPAMDESGIVNGYRGNTWVFENKVGVAEDLRFLAHMPELCDVTFLVGEKRDPVCAVRAILAARSRIFHKMLYSASRGATPRKKTATSSEKIGKRVSQMIRRNSVDLSEDSALLAGPRTVVVDEFDPAVFRQLIQYCHTGCITLKPKIVLGLMNAADHYGLDELRRACMGYLQTCVNIDTVCQLLRSAEKYIQYKSTKSLVQKALEFVDVNAESVLRLPTFTSLPNHVARLILSRDELQADELTKFHAALAWSRAHIEKHPGSQLREVMTPFVDSIQFHLIPATTLMQNVKPTGAIPDQKIMTALAYQADPTSVKPGSLLTSPARLRLSMLNLNIEESPPSLSGPGSRRHSATPSPSVSVRSSASQDSPNASLHISLSTRRASAIDKLSLDNEQNNNNNDVDATPERTVDTEKDFHHERTVDFEHELQKTTRHNGNNNHNRHDRSDISQCDSVSKLGLRENFDASDHRDDQENDEEIDERLDHVDLMFKPDIASSSCFSDTSMSCSLSTCSDWTDSGSSAGGSFGRADHKENGFKLLIPNEIQYTTH